MLGYTPIAGSALGASTPAPITVDAVAQTLGSIDQSTAQIAVIEKINGAQTLANIGQLTASGYFATGAQTLSGVTQNVVAGIFTAVHASVTLEGATQSAVGSAAEFVVQGVTLDNATQVAAANVFWHLPSCGWIAEAAGLAKELLMRHLPLGSAWITWRMPGKVAYRLVTALAAIYDDATQFFCHLTEELDPRTAVDMMPEWEEATGLPDACLPTARTLLERRGLVLLRLSHRRWTTASDWHDLAALFGLQITITPGWWVQKPALYPNCYPKRYDLFPKLGRFRVYIDFKNIDFGGYDYGVDGRGPGYPVPYGVTQSELLNNFMCMIERIRPANVIVIWNERPWRYACVPPNGI
jgi:hypothetical protein